MRICTARPRKTFETYGMYRKNLKEEQRQMKGRLAGRYIRVMGIMQQVSFCKNMA